MKKINICIFGNGINLHKSDLLTTHKILKRMMQTEESILKTIQQDLQEALYQAVYYKKWIIKWANIVNEKICELLKPTYLLKLKAIFDLSLKSFLQDIESIIFFWQLYYSWKKHKYNMFSSENAETKHKEMIRFLFIEAIYAEGLINDIEINEDHVNKIANISDKIFTFNYDNNLERLFCNRKIIHLHGNFKTIKSNYDIKKNRASYINWEAIPKNKRKTLLKSNIETWKSNENAINEETIKKWYKKKPHMLSNIIIKQQIIFTKAIENLLSRAFDNANEVINDKDEYENVYIYGLSLRNEDLNHIINKANNIHYYCHSDDDFKLFLNWKENNEKIYENKKFLCFNKESQIFIKK